jgi:hypothetical protein
MKSPLLVVFLSVIFVLTSTVEAQKRRLPSKSKQSSAAGAQKSKEIGSSAVVIDESLAVLRIKPSLFSDSIQRMRRGRRVQIMDSKEADGVKFYRISASPNNQGWVQSEAVFGRFRRGDDERLARLVQATEGFDQIEIAMQFLEIYPSSPLRPSILLLFGDLIEETALRLSRDAARRLDRRAMAATGAPLHSFYLNFVMLDRYRKLGIVFLFNSNSKSFHYDGASWREIINKFPNSSETVEARKRLDSLKEKIERKL